MTALRIAAFLAAAIGVIPLVAALCSDGTGLPAGIVPAPRVNTTSPAAAAGAIAVPAGPNLLANGDFVRGSGKSPDHWRTGGWNESPAVTAYDWLHSSGSAPELMVNNIQPNDARWLQTLTLGPGWYYVGTEARSEDVPLNAAGVYISLNEGSVNSPDLHGTAEWQRLGLYLKVGAHGADVDVALRLGGFGSLNTGRAFFRDARVVKLDALPAAAAPVFDLGAVRRSLVAPPVGKPWTLAAVFLLLAIATVAGWKIYGAGDLAPAPLESRTPPASSRSERRRRGQDRARRRR